MGAFAHSLERRSARALLLALALVAPSAWAETRSATRLTCWVDSGDVLATADAGEPGPDASGGFDFEQLASRRSARDSRLRLTSSLHENGFLPGIMTHAVLRLDAELNLPAPVVLSAAFRANWFTAEAEALAWLAQFRPAIGMP